MLFPPPQYQSVPKQITITPKKSPLKSALGGHSKISTLKKSSKSKKKLLIKEPVGTTASDISSRSCEVHDPPTDSTLDQIRATELKSTIKV